MRPIEVAFSTCTSPTLFLFPRSDEDSDSDEDDSDDEDDDEKELQAELERIRAERAAAQAKKLQEEKDIEEKLKRDSALKSNPLLTSEDSSAKVSHINRIPLPIDMFTDITCCLCS